MTSLRVCSQIAYVPHYPYQIIKMGEMFFEQEISFIKDLLPFARERRGEKREKTTRSSAEGKKEKTTLLIVAVAGQSPCPRWWQARSSPRQSFAPALVGGQLALAFATAPVPAGSSCASYQSCRSSDA
ncbi:hypothetical protein NE237_001910 [Protea cynaroides]|uniref:Uncharacterized protein n=1 Tax=Protea cynaroides TaxID=273540 RepID=A0A9Q0KUF8_9MAGN|nr:hypothetical protein NE237_001910 [Protea cynaroides]